MRITKIVIMAVVVIASSLLILVPPAVAQAPQGQSWIQTIQGIAEPEGGCKYSVPMNTHGKSISEDPSKCTIVFELERGPGPEMPASSDVTLNSPTKPDSSETIAGFDMPTTLDGPLVLSHAHLGVWNINPYDGAWDDAVTSVVEWYWNGSSTWASNDWTVTWYNAPYGWYYAYGPYHSHIYTSNGILSHSVVGFQNSYSGWVDYFPSVDVVGYANGYIDCDFTREYYNYGSESHPIGVSCYIDWEQW